MRMQNAECRMKNFVGAIIDRQRRGMVRIRLRLRQIRKDDTAGRSLTAPTIQIGQGGCTRKGGVAHEGL